MSLRPSPVEFLILVVAPIPKIPKHETTVTDGASADDPTDSGRDALLDLLPTLLRPFADREFNVFDVMRHGQHEKQLSDIFAWLLNDHETHKLGDRFLRIFIEELNARKRFDPPIAIQQFLVRSEVDTAKTGERADIADILLTGEKTVIVIENFYTSSGHGHGYDTYKRFGETEENEGKRSVVVLLCEFKDESLLTDGWENAPVVTYDALVRKLWSKVDGDARYKSNNPDIYWFICQMHDHFVKGKQKRMNDEHLLEFVSVMCETGQAKRYGERPHLMDPGGSNEPLILSVAQHFNEGRELLARVKTELRRFSRTILVKQVNEHFGRELLVGAEKNSWQGIYLWTVKLATEDDNAFVRLMIGPTAWEANTGGGQRDSAEHSVVASDYTRIFIQHEEAVIQSEVKLNEVLDGLDSDDTRLLDEILALLGEAVT